jgi:hypothetical protein
MMVPFHTIVIIVKSELSVDLYEKISFRRYRLVVAGAFRWIGGLWHRSSGGPAKPIFGRTTNEYQEAREIKSFHTGLPKRHECRLTRLAGCIHLFFNLPSASEGFLRHEKALNSIGSGPMRMAVFAVRANR